MRTGASGKVWATWREGVAMQCSNEQAIKLVADDVAKIRKCDVYRLLDWYPQLDGFPQWLKNNRPDLIEEIDTILSELGKVE